MSSYPEPRSCLQLTMAGKGEISFPNSVSLGVLTTLKGRPRVSKRWATTTTEKFSGLWSDFLSKSALFGHLLLLLLSYWSFVYVLWFLILCFYEFCMYFSYAFLFVLN